MQADETVRVSLRGAALAVMKHREDEVLVEGPAGTGKSFAALYKIHLMCLGTPGMRALMVRKTHRSLSSTGLVTFREQVAAHAIKAGLLKWYGGSGEKPAQYIYSNGSVIVVGGMDNADKVMSSEYDVVFAQEATELTLDDVEKINTRLRNGVTSFQQLIMDCNPQQPSHWLNQRCKDKKTVRLQSRHEDNPRLFSHEPSTGSYRVTEYGQAYMNKLDNLTGVRKLRLRDGKWAAAEGIIYDGWMPSVHLSDRKRLPLDWVRIWSVDFGFVHPFVWQQWAIDPDGRMYLEHEIYRTKRLVEEHAHDIMKITRKNPRENGGRTPWPRTTEEMQRLPWKYPKPRVLLCDHDAEDRATLEKHLGMGTVPAWKSVSDGIQAMQKRLVVQPDGKPRLFVLRDSLFEVDRERKEAGRPTCFEDEIEGYVWKPRPQAVQGRERPEPDEPDKIDDDSMDTARYAVAYSDLQPSPRVRWM